MVLKIAETILSKYNTKHHNVWIERKLTNTNRSGSKLEKAVIKSFSNGPFSASIFAFTFSTVITADLFIIKKFSQLDSNHGPLISKATTVPT